MNAVSPRYALALQLLSAFHNLRVNPGISQFSDMSTTELDYATEILRSWERVCSGNTFAVSSLKYWSALYDSVRFISDSSFDRYLDADAGAELSWAESVLGGSEGSLGEG